jgi:mono/diheme cytochrome c family protein
MDMTVADDSRHPARHACLAFAATIVLLVIGCSDDFSEHLIKANVGHVESVPQRPGDPRAGYETIVNGDYMSCGVPYSAWRRVSGPPSSPALLPDREGRNADLPYFLSVSEDPQGVEVVTNNCLYCHANSFNGSLIIGLGNESRDFTQDPRTLVEAVGAYVSGRQETQAWTKWAQRISAIAGYMMTDTVGVNPAPNLTLALIAHRNPRTLAWSDDPVIAPPPERPLPVSVPPWWRMAKKNAMFYNAMGRGDHARIMMMKSLVCTDTVTEAEQIDASFTNVRAYIASLEPPRYPFSIDRALAEQGRIAFDEECAGCHGTYGPNGDYPNRLIALDVVGTDPAYARRAYEESDRFMNWFNRSWYGTVSEARPAAGYVAPPLDGIWATAPFLHNGSVPTIAALLDSRLRPTYWTRSFDPMDFDEVQVGWPYEALPSGKEAESDAARRKRIYDTTRFGYSNVGHSFGDDLGAAEQRAILEYLKTL